METFFLFVYRTLYLPFIFADFISKELLYRFWFTNFNRLECHYLRITGGSLVESKKTSLQKETSNSRYSPDAN